MELLQTCIFMPFINENTPKPFNLPVSDPILFKEKKNYWLPDNKQLEELFELLTKISTAQVQTHHKWMNIQNKNNDINSMMNQSFIINGGEGTENDKTSAAQSRSLYNKYKSIEFDGRKLS